MIRPAAALAALASAAFCDAASAQAAEARAAYAPPPVGAVHVWRYQLEGEPSSELRSRVLAAGPRFAVIARGPASAPPEIFVEYLGFAALDCFAPMDDAALRLTVRQLNGLWPLEPGQSSGPFTVIDIETAPAGGVEPSGARRYVVDEQLFAGAVKWVWSPALGRVVEHRDADGGVDRLVAIEPPTTPQTAEIPALCRSTLPPWFWREAGVE